MNMDIRLPLGLMFVILGVLISGYGLLTAGQGEIYRRSLDINMNLWWGSVLLVFGLVFVFLGRRHGR